MPSISVVINGRKYNMACDEGEEERLRALAEDFDQRITEVKRDLGEIGDARLTVVAALMLADELADANARLRELENEVAAVKERGAAAAMHVQATQAAVIAALNAASERIEHVTRGLNRSLTDSVPIG